MQISQPLSGITTPLATPLINTRTLDEAGLERLVTHVLDGGVNCLFILGTTGEGPSLAPALQQHIVSRVCELANHRVPVLVGITDTSYAEAVTLAEAGAKAGAAGVVYAGPAYFTVSQSELVEHTARLAGEVPLPMFVYNMPSHTRVGYELDSVRQLCGVEKIIGLKDSSGNLMYFQRACQITAQRKNFSVLMGPEELLTSAVLAGANGGVNGGSNLFPRLYVSMYRAASSGDIREAVRLQEVVLDISSNIYNAGTYSSSYLKGLKCALSILNICSSELAEPYAGLGAADRARIAERLAALQAAHPELR